METLIGLFISIVITVIIYTFLIKNITKFGKVFFIGTSTFIAVLAVFGSMYYSLSYAFLIIFGLSVGVGILFGTKNYHKLIRQNIISEEVEEIEIKEVPPKFDYKKLEMNIQSDEDELFEQIEMITDDENSSEGEQTNINDITDHDEEELSEEHYDSKENDTENTDISKEQDTIEGFIKNRESLIQDIEKESPANKEKKFSESEENDEISLANSDRFSHFEDLKITYEEQQEKEND